MCEALTTRHAPSGMAAALSSSDSDTTWFHLGPVLQAMTNVAPSGETAGSSQVWFPESRRRILPDSGTGNLSGGETSPSRRRTSDFGDSSPLLGAKTWTSAGGRLPSGGSTSWRTPPRSSCRNGARFPTASILIMWPGGLSWTAPTPDAPGAQVNPPNRNDPAKPIHNVSRPTFLDNIFMTREVTQIPSKMHRWL